MSRLSVMMHTMIRVFDLDKSIDFYTTSRHEAAAPQGLSRRRRFTLAFVGYGEATR